MLGDSLRGTFGGAKPSKWGKLVRGIGPTGCRLLAQARMFCCSSVGGHLHGWEGCRKCGACGANTGRVRTIDGLRALDNSVEHLFKCEAMRELRVRSGVEVPQDMWRKKPKVVLLFLTAACKVSRDGIHAQAGKTLGQDWTWTP